MIAVLHYIPTQLTFRPTVVSGNAVPSYHLACPYYSPLPHAFHLQVDSLNRTFPVLTGILSEIAQSRFARSPELRYESNAVRIQISGSFPPVDRGK